MFEFDEFGYSMLPLDAFSPVGKQMSLHGKSAPKASVPKASKKAEALATNDIVPLADRQLEVAKTVTPQIIDAASQQYGQATDASTVADKQALLAQNYLNFVQDQYADDKEFGNMLTSLNLGSAATNFQRGQEAADFERNTYRPLVQRIVNDAMAYNTDAKREQLASTARADIETAYANERERAMREMSRFGINPNSGRFAAINQRLGVAQAADTAGAMNRARLAADEIAAQRMLAAEGIARNNSTIANQAFGLTTDNANAALQTGRFAGDRLAAGAGQAGNLFGNASSAYGNASNMYGNAASTYGNATVPYSNTASTYGIAANAYNNVASTQASIANANAQAQAQQNAGTSSAIGSIAGSALAAFMLMPPSSKDYKENKTGIETGKALRGIKNLDVEKWDYKKGVADEGRHVGPYAEDFKREFGIGNGRSIPMQDAIGVTMKAVQDLAKEVESLKGGKGMRSGGRVTGPGGPVDDKVPAMLSNGEYVIPADTAKHIGYDKLDRLVKETHTPAAVQRKQRGIRRK